MAVNPAPPPAPPGLPADLIEKLRMQMTQVISIIYIKKKEKAGFQTNFYFWVFTFFINIWLMG